MNVLSLFDGMSCGRIALERLGIPIDNYYASEIDKYAIQVSQANYPDIIQVGDILNWQDWDIDWESIDLVTGGFPCQSWSVAGKGLGDRDDRGKLFWDMLDVMNKVMENNPSAYYLMENVRMKKEFEEYITMHTENALPNVNKYMINSALVSAQNRIRFYWTNIKNVEQPEDKGIVLKDILENDAEEPMYSNIYGGFGEKKPREHFNKSITIRANSGGGAIPNVKLKPIRVGINIEKDKDQYIETKPVKVCNIYPSGGQNGNVYSDKGKSPTLSAGQGVKGRGIGSNNAPKIKTKPKTIQINKENKEVYWRKLTPVECERLQTVSDNYTNHVSNTQRYKMLGNGWTIEVITHILKNINKSKGK
jgi:DNA-cytosine methyltransferase